MRDSTPPGNSAHQSLTLALVKRNPWFLGLATLPLLFASYCIVFGISAKLYALVAIAPYLIILAGSLWMMLWMRNPRPREIENGLTVDEKGVHVGQTLILPKEKIKSGFVVPRPDKRPIVRLEKHGIGPATEIRVENEEDGREVLRRLGFDATQTTASFVLPSRMFVDSASRRRMAFVISAAFGSVGVLTGLLKSGFEFIPFLLGLITIAFGTAALLTRTHVRVGADGIVLRWFRTEMFIPFDEIKEIESYEEKRAQRRRWAGVHLRLRSGKTITLPISSAGTVGAPRLRLVTHRLQQALDDHRRGVRASAEARLMRGDRALPAWIRELRRAGSGAAADHRHAPIPMDRLLELAEDPHVDATTRANAAIALGGNAEQVDVHKRLRVAAQATAAPKLRVILENAASMQDEEALAEALAEVEAEAEKSARSK